MGPFPSLFSNQYILLAIDYVSKWVEEVALSVNDTKLVVRFLCKHIFSRFETPRTLVSDEKSHFCSKQLEETLAKYNVKHGITTTYHPQANRKAEVSN